MFQCRVMESMLLAQGRQQGKQTLHFLKFVKAAGDGMPERESGQGGLPIADAFARAGQQGCGGGAEAEMSVDPYVIAPGAGRACQTQKTGQTLLCAALVIRKDMGQFWLGGKQGRHSAARVEIDFSFRPDGVQNPDQGKSQHGVAQKGCIPDSYAAHGKIPGSREECKGKRGRGRFIKNSSLC